jgi:hypothetical protein
MPFLRQLPTTGVKIQDWVSVALLRQFCEDYPQEYDFVLSKFEAPWRQSIEFLRSDGVRPSAIESAIQQSGDEQIPLDELTGLVPKFGEQ